MFGFDQHSKYHDSDVWEHSLRTFAAVKEKKLSLRLAALLHDIGKPCSFTQDEDGTGHFYGHAKQSVSLACGLLNRLRCDNATKQAVLTLIEYHDTQLAPTPKSVKRWLGRLGPELFFDLIRLQEADSAAHAAPYVPERLAALGQIARWRRRRSTKVRAFRCATLPSAGTTCLRSACTGRKSARRCNICWSL